MNFFCRIFGHTWVPGIDAPEVRWNTTKDMQILAPTVEGKGIRHFEVCARCAEERSIAPRAHDADPLPGAHDDVAEAG